MIVNIQSDLGYGLTEFLASTGYDLQQRGNEWHLNGALTLEAAQAAIDLYNPWPVEKANKLAEIDDAFAIATNNLTAGWPQHEIQTWSKQESEARAFIVDPDAPTPMLSIIASTRELTVEQLALRVVRDADAFTHASAYYVGLRHKARQRVQAMPDVGLHERLPELWSIKFGD